MKSLEIVNDKIAELKDTYQHYTAVEKDKVKSSFAKFDIEQFQQIKQDLEVLEIIYKKRIAMEYLWFLYDYYKDFTNGINYMLEKINEHQDETRKLTMEELLKLKQWLERGNLDE